MSDAVRMNSLMKASLSSPHKKVDDKLDEVSKGMEKVFLKYLFDELRKSESSVDMFGNKKKSSFFEDGLYDEYAKLISERGEFGLAKMIKEQVLKTNGVGGTK